MNWLGRFRKTQQENLEPGEDQGPTPEAPPQESPPPEAPQQESPAPAGPPGGQAGALHAAAADGPGGGGLFARMRQGLEKTSRLLRTDVRDLFKQEGQLVDDEFLRQLYALAIRTDMGPETANALRSEMQTAFRARVVTMDQVLEQLRHKLLELIHQQQSPLNMASQGPTVIMVVGVNGSGKTTTIAKLAHRLRNQGLSVVLGAADTFRAAAVEQLTVWAERIGAQIVTGPSGSDPASVAHRAVALCREQGAQACIVDTAGRLQTQSNLMDQLGKIRRVIQKQIPEAPQEVLLVLDATAGQNGISQAQGFSQAAHCTGIVLAKLDGTAKGGVIVPIRRQFDVPVKFVGVGEKLDDLAPFDPVQFVEALLAEPSPKAA